MIKSAFISFLLISMFFLLFLFGCSTQPSESAIQTAIAKTQSAQPNNQPIQPQQGRAMLKFSFIPISITGIVPMIVLEI